jgi:hypothetical protein
MRTAVTATGSPEVEAASCRQEAWVCMEHVGQWTVSLERT